MNLIKNLFRKRVERKKLELKAIQEEIDNIIINMYYAKQFIYSDPDDMDETKEDYLYSDFMKLLNKKNRKKQFIKRFSHDKK